MRASPLYLSTSFFPSLSLSPSLTHTHTTLMLFLSLSLSCALSTFLIGEAL